MDTDIKLKHVFRIDDFIVDTKSKNISVPSSWMEEHGESFFPLVIKNLLKENYKIQLNLL